MLLKYSKYTLLFLTFYTQTQLPSVPSPIDCNCAQFIPNFLQDNPAINTVQAMKRTLKNNNSIIAIIKTKAPSSDSFKLNCSLLAEIQEIFKDQLEELSEIPINPEKTKFFSKRQRYFQKKLTKSQSFSRDMQVVLAILDLR